MPFSTVQSVLSSPEYKEHSGTIAKAVEDEGVLNLVAGGVADGLDSEDVQKKMRDEIENLNATVKQIRATFSKVQGNLYTFDQEKFEDVDGNVLELQPGWKALSKRFDATLATSRDIAGSAVGFLKTYSATMLVNVKEEDIPDLKNDLKSFQDMLPEKQREADANRESFADLAKEVRLYKEKIQSAVTRAETRLVQDIQNAENQKTQIKMDIERLEDEMQSLLIAIGVSAAVAGGAALLALITLSPAAAITALTSALTAVAKAIQYMKLKKEHTGKADELRKVESELKALYRKQEVLGQFKATMDGTYSDIDGLAVKLDTIANIWGSLSTDLEQFSQNIDFALQMRRNRAFLAGVDVARKLYDKLVDLLELYVKGAIICDD